MTRRTHITRSRRPRGFSLVEVLVGVAIGMVGMLVIFRTVATWDTHTRSTTSGSDAQSAGALAMFNLERDVKQAGLGFMGIGPPPPLATPPASLGCPVVGADSATGRVLNFNMVPVQIVLNAGLPDTINVLYGNSPFFVSEEKFTASTDTTKTLERRSGFKRGDVAIAASALNCALLQVTDDANPDGKTIGHTPGATYANFYAVPAANAVARYNTAAPPAFALGNIYSLGPLPRRDSWQVDVARARLTNTELFGGAPAFEVAEGVVNMKALYGLDLDGDRRVDTWTNVAPLTPLAWSQVLSIRVGLLVRSRQFEKTADQSASGVPTGVTTIPPTWSGASLGVANSSFVMTNVNGGADTFGPNDPDPNNWRFYRYRVYEKEIPLRNVMWGMSPGS